MIRLNNKLSCSNFTTTNSLIFNSLKLVVNVLFPFLLIPYIARILSVEQIGIYNWDLSVINYLIVLAGLSLPIIGMREIGLNKKSASEIQKIINNIFVMKFFTISVAALLLIFISYVQNFENNQGILLSLGLIMIFEIIGHEWVYAAFGDQKSILFRSFIGKLLLLLSTFILVKDESDFTIFIIIYIVSTIFPYILGYKYLFITFRPTWIKLTDIRYFNLSTMKSFSISLLMAFYGKVDVVILGFILTSEEFGVFSSAYKLVMLALVFITTWSMVLLPRSSTLNAENNSEKYLKFIHKSLDLVLVVGLFITITLIMYSESIVLLIFGENFYEAAWIVSYLAPITVILSLYNVLIFQVLYVKNYYTDIMKYFTAIYFTFLLILYFFTLDVSTILMLILGMNALQLGLTIFSVRKFYMVTFFDLNKVKIYLVAITILGLHVFFISESFFELPYFFIYLFLSSVGYFALLLLVKEKIVSMAYKKLMEVCRSVP
jgi:O-antigen/teichoic acid export membrane protein